MKAIAVMSHLLLQKPFAKVKTREAATHLTRRLELLEEG
jgi:hypothetical protein